MNWLIDGSYGDLYRAAMNYPALQPVPNEADLYGPRNLGRARNLLLACGGHLSLVFGILCGALPGNLYTEEQNHGRI
jgi:hypothetical protein